MDEQISLGLDHRPNRALLLGLLNQTISLGKRSWPVQIAIEVAAASLARQLAGEAQEPLPLPESLPLSQPLCDEYDE
ncbi:MAG: hypothetical protein AB8B77_06985 [Alphaproteobacteria bacterium]